MPQQPPVMKNVLGTSTPLDAAFLDSMREVVDPPADRVAVTMCEGDAYKVFADLVKKRAVWDDDGAPSRKLPEHLREHLKASSALPTWIKHAKVKTAEQFFLLYGISSATQLSCASLPECYIMRYGTEVLAFTKFLQIDPARRIREDRPDDHERHVPGRPRRRRAGRDWCALDPESAGDARHHPLHDRTR